MEKYVVNVPYERQKMSLKRVSYFEYKDDPKYWEMKDCDFVSVNLVVGVNTTGKTRFLNVVNSFCKILSAKLTTPLQSGTYDFDVQLDGDLYNVKMEFAGGLVVSEVLSVNKKIRMSRDSDGKGKIYYAKEVKTIDFQVPENVIAIQQRRDTLQHPFIVKLAEWADTCEFFAFSAAFGNTSLLSMGALQAQGPLNDARGKNLVKSYIQGFEQFKAPLDKAIIRDMKALGYNLTDVSAEDIRSLHPEITLAEPVLGICVTERQIGKKKSFRDLRLSQLQMSQGMYRALSLVVHLNIASMSTRPSLFLIDDIGEGLDYERSTSIIDLLIHHSAKSVHQVIMTSNDRFVMNRVPLQYWTIFNRQVGVVTAFTSRSHPKDFKEFEYMGLSNFDFFKSNSLQ